MKSTRRRFLATSVTLTAGGLAGCSSSSSGPSGDVTKTATSAPTGTATPTESTMTNRSVETVVSIPGERVPENMAFDTAGNLYFGITAGEVRRLPADQTGATELTVDATDQLGTLPGAVGIETGPDGTVYAAVATQDDRSGIWTVTPDGMSSQLVEISGFPNDMLYDVGRDRLLVTESSNGVVYAIETDGSRTTWLDDDRLATESFGANGITRDSDGTVHVSVTRTANETGRVIQASVQDDGSAGEASVLFAGGEIFGADGITARAGHIYVAVNSQNRVVRVSPEGSTSVVATADDGLVFPSDVLFGVGEQSESLYICNFANRSPEDGAILRTQI